MFLEIMPKIWTHILYNYSSQIHHLVSQCPTTHIPWQFGAIVHPANYASNLAAFKEPAIMEQRNSRESSSTHPTT